MSRIPLKRLYGGIVSAAQAARHKKRPAGTLILDRQPFDLAKIQREPIRQHRRQLLLRWSLPVVLVMAAVALWFLLPTPLTHQAIGDYHHQSYRTARLWLTPLTWTSPQPFVIAFNSGTVDTQAGNYTRAQAELTRALEIAPADKRCMVLQNLAISLTDHAANLTSQNRSQDALAYNTQAASLKSNNAKCFHTLKTTPPKKNNQGGGGGAQSQSQQILTPAQQAELQQKDLSGQQSQQQDFNPSDINLTSPANKPW